MDRVPGARTQPFKGIDLLDFVEPIQPRFGKQAKVSMCGDCWHGLARGILSLVAWIVRGGKTRDLGDASDF